jgi:hypothetical protein
MAATHDIPLALQLLLQLLHTIQLLPLIGLPLVRVLGCSRWRLLLLLLVLPFPPPLFMLLLLPLLLLLFMLAQKTRQ